MMKLILEDMKKLREEHINETMSRKEVKRIMNNNKLLVETKGDNEEWVRLFDKGDYYLVESSWRIDGRFNDVWKAKRLYENLVNELVADV